MPTQFQPSPFNDVLHQGSYMNTETKEGKDFEMCVQRKSTLSKFQKDVFIQEVKIVNFEECGGHINYILQVKGRTKYLIDAGY